MNTKKNILFVVNPISGTKAKNAIVKMISERLDAERFDYKVMYSQFAGHEYELSKEAADEGLDAVIAVGGDGTVNEVARGLAGTETALGIIPCGSGNGLARHLSIPMDPRRAIDIINRCTIVNIDYCTVNGRAFFSVCGTGFDAYISDKFAHAGSRGLRTYVRIALRSFFEYEPETYKIEFDGQEQSCRAFLVTCANSSQYGNDAYVAPLASVQDGKMNVTIIEPFSIFAAPRIGFQLFTKHIQRNPHVNTLTCRCISIHRGSPAVAHIDGDPVLLDKDLEVAVIPSGLKVIANHNSAL